MAECIFCEIAAGRSPASVEYEDERVVAFQDIYPKAPLHLLIIPKKHIPSVVDLEAADADLVSHMIFVAKQLAEQRHLRGYKLIFNVGKEGGQIIFHLHLHLLGGWEKPAGEIG